MAKTKDDGGPAFPQLNIESGERDGHGDLIDPITASQGGMTMRDYIATESLGVAYQEWLRHWNPEKNGYNTTDRDKFISEIAYRLADAMLLARSGANDV